MPQIITNTSERQVHLLYPNKRNNNNNSMTAKARADSPEKATAIPKTYDAIKKRRRSGHESKRQKVMNSLFF